MAERYITDNNTSDSLVIKNPSITTDGDISQRSDPSGAIPGAAVSGLSVAMSMMGGFGDIFKTFLYQPPSGLIPIIEALQYSMLTTLKLNPRQIITRINTKKHLHYVLIPMVDPLFSVKPEGLTISKKRVLASPYLMKTRAKLSKNGFKIDDFYDKAIDSDTWKKFLPIYAQSGMYSFHNARMLRNYMNSVSPLLHVFEFSVYLPFRYLSTLISMNLRMYKGIALSKVGKDLGLHNRFLTGDNDYPITGFMMIHNNAIPPSRIASMQVNTAKDTDSNVIRAANRLEVENFLEYSQIGYFQEKPWFAVFGKSRKTLNKGFTKVVDSRAKVVFETIFDTSDQFKYAIM